MPKNNDPSVAKLVRDTPTAQADEDAAKPCQDKSRRREESRSTFRAASKRAADTAKQVDGSVAEPSKAEGVTAFLDDRGANADVDAGRFGGVRAQTLEGARPQRAIASNEELSPSDATGGFGATQGHLGRKPSSVYAPTRVLLASVACPALEAYSLALESVGFDVESTKTIRGADAAKLCAEEKYGIVLFEGSTQTDSRLSLCRDLRKNGYPWLLVIITRSERESYHAQVLQAGADDVLTMGADPNLFVARLEAGFRRLCLHAGPAVQQRVSGMTVDSLVLTRIEERLLACFVASAGLPVPPEILCHHAWPGQKVMRHTLHVHLSALRQKLIDHGCGLENVRGKGYLLQTRQPDRDSLTSALGERTRTSRNLEKR